MQVAAEQLYKYKEHFNLLEGEGGQGEGEGGGKLPAWPWGR